MTAIVTYTINGNKLGINYEATTTKKTVVNLTNHVYFNLDGHSNWKDLSNQTVSIFADNYTPVDIDAIPLGDISDVAGTPYDLRNGKYMTSKALEAVDPKKDIFLNKNVNDNSEQPELPYQGKYFWVK